MSDSKFNLDFINENFDTLLKEHKTAVMGLTMFGAAVLLKHSLSNLYKFYTTFLRPSKNLFKRYQGGYVVVTGATFGLGFEYAKQFAQKGFNLVLIARNPERLEKSKQEILKLTPDIDIQTIVFDFDVPYTEDNYNGLLNHLHEIEDISVLVNNVGVMTLGPYEKIDLNSVNSMIQVNCLPQTILTRALIPNMLKRSKEGKRCAILNLSSVAPFTKLGTAAIYAATKAFNSVFSNVITKEYGEFIDVISIHPGPTKSNMIRFYGPLVISPEAHVKWALSDVGYDYETLGHYHHYIYCGAYRLPFFEKWYTWMRNSVKLDPIK